MILDPESSKKWNCNTSTLYSSSPWTFVCEQVEDTVSDGGVARNRCVRHRFRDDDDEEDGSGKKGRVVGINRWEKMNSFPFEVHHVYTVWRPLGHDVLFIFFQTFW